MKTFLSDQEKKLTEMLNPISFMSVGSDYTLFKLPLMGKPTEKPDFEWPTQQDWEKMQDQSDIRLASLEIWCGNGSGVL